MADTVTATPAVQTQAPAVASAPAKKDEKGQETSGTVATAGTPIKGSQAPEHGKKLYIVA